MISIIPGIWLSKLRCLPF